MRSELSWVSSSWQRNLYFRFARHEEDRIYARNRVIWHQHRHPIYKAFLIHKNDISGKLLPLYVAVFIPRNFHQCKEGIMNVNAWDSQTSFNWHNIDPYRVDFSRQIISFKLLVIGFAVSIWCDDVLYSTIRMNHKNLYKNHDDVMKWKHFPCYWPFVRRNSPVPGEFSAQRPVTRSFDVFFDLQLICTWINSRVNNPEAGDLTGRWPP